MAAATDRSAQILTFLYTDIEGSTRLWEQYPDSMEAAIARQDQILRDVIEINHGYIFRTVGDGICAVFENASQALATALAAQLDLLAESWGEISALQVRIAIHTGEVDPVGDDFSGSSLNRIGRLLGVTNGGQTLVSQATQLLVRDILPPSARLLDLGEVRLRDLSQPERVFQLIHPDLPDEFPPLASLDVHPNNLPIQPTALIGREMELEAICTRLTSMDIRLLTLTGPGGTGKTRLSLQAAADLNDHFAEGVFFVDLAPIRDPEGVLPAIARTLGIKKISHRPILDELKERLHDQEMLLLLDNFEQITAAAPLVVELLLSSPRLKMLVTSREPLHVRSEHIFPIPPLALPQPGEKLTAIDAVNQFSAVRLFVERAQSVRPDFKLTDENASAVAEICLRLDGLPLTIELAASRIKLFPPRVLLQRLSSSLRLLTGGARDLPVRQQTLRDTIGWSYELLDTSEQRLFEVLSVFLGGCTFEAIESIANSLELVAETGVDPIDGLVSLVDKSLLRQVEDVNGEPRLVMFETIREYAAEQLEGNSVLSAAAHRAHATYFADFTQDQWGYLTSEHSDVALRQMDLEIENVREAWRYWIAAENLEQLDKFIDVLWLVYETRGWYPAMVDLTKEKLAVHASFPSTPERARQEIVLQTNLASTLLITKGYMSSDVEQAFNRALELIEQQDEFPQLFPVLRGLSRYYSYRGEFEKAIRVGEQILSLADQLDDPDLFVVGHLVLGTNITFYQGLQAGLEHLEKGISHYVPDRHRLSRFRFGTDHGIACTITSAINLWMLGYPDTAINRANTTIDVAKDLNHPFSIAYATFHTGLLYLWSIQPELALGKAQSLLEMADEYEFDIWIAVGLCLHGAALVQLGQLEDGLTQIHQGMDKYQGLTTPPIFWTLLLFNQAEAYRHAGKLEEGLNLMVESLGMVEPSGEGALLAEFQRLRGDLLLALSSENAPEAELWYQKACEIAQKQQARMLLLRAAIRLCRLWREQGELEAAQRLLSEVYYAMTEGFETPELKEAKAILETLA